MVSAVEAIRATVAALPDPEIPALTLEDLGILRGVRRDRGGQVVVTLTPTYTGCPAIGPIRDDVRRALRAGGHDDVEVRLQLAPAWTTDWISEAGRRKLLAYGIAPPERRADACPAMARTRCPRCGSEDTREISRFGATPCQAQHACNACREPFDRFKAI